VAGHPINAVSEAFHWAHSALRKWVQRFAQEGPQGLRDRPRSGRPPHSPVSWNSPSNASLSQTPWSTARSMPHGVVVRWRPSSPGQPGSTWAGHVSAGC
jgi:hypothetical protein